MCQNAFYPRDQGNGFCSTNAAKSECMYLISTQQCRMYQPCTLASRCWWKRRRFLYVTFGDLWTAFVLKQVSLLILPFFWRRKECQILVYKKNRSLIDIGVPTWNVTYLCPPEMLPDKLSYFSTLLFCGLLQHFFCVNRHLQYLVSSNWNLHSWPVCRKELVPV